MFKASRYGTVSYGTVIYGTVKCATENVLLGIVI